MPKKEDAEIKAYAQKCTTMTWTKARGASRLGSCTKEKEH